MLRIVSVLFCPEHTLVSQRALHSVCGLLVPSQLSKLDAGVAQRCQRHALLAPQHALLCWQALSRHSFLPYAFAVQHVAC